MNDKISELMDGELDGRAAAGVIDALQREGEALETWRTYHLISDAMRDTRLLSPGFAARVGERLAREPTVVAPRRLQDALRAEPGRQRVALPAAAAASVAAVGLVGWLAFSQAPAPAPAPVARAPSVQAVIQPVVALKPANVPLPSAMPDYLLAHQGFSPRLSLHGMAPYARTVSEQVTEGRK